MSEIIHRGILTKEKLKELVYIHFGLNNDDHLFNPVKNHEVISITKQPDGNYIGLMWKNDKLIEVRQIDPNTVLNMLLTHE